jgi:hypothetical protein
VSRSANSPGKATLLLALLVGVTLTACGNTASAPMPLPKGHASPSVIQGLPVPAQARVTAEHLGRGIVYGLVGVPLNSVDSWYQSQLPPGRNWRDWIWVPQTGPRCLSLFATQNVLRFWTNANSVLFLAAWSTLDNTTATPATDVEVALLPGPAIHC